MAESSLSITYSQLQRHVGRYLGWDRDPTNWTSSQTTDFGDILAAGLRKFYFPMLPDGGQMFEWSFLRPRATLPLVIGDADYDLPDDCSGVIVPNSMTFSTGDAKRPLVKVDEAKIRSVQSTENAASATPRYFAVRPKAHSPTTGLRWEVLFYPTPNAVLTVQYRYVVQPNTLDGTNIYPYGGAAHSHTIMSAVLAAAEAFMDDDAGGPHEKAFQEFLTASMRIDQEHGAVS